MRENAMLRLTQLRVALLLRRFGLLVLGLRGYHLRLR